MLTNMYIHDGLMCVCLPICLLASLCLSVCLSVGVSHIIYFVRLFSVTMNLMKSLLMLKRGLSQTHTHTKLLSLSLQYNYFRPFR